MFIIKLLSQHVSDIIMLIIRRTRVCTAAYDVLHWLWWLWLCGAGKRAVCSVKVPSPHNHSHHNQCRTPYAAVHTLVLLTMSIMMPETCWDKSLIINIRLVASCWFLSLHPTFMMHGHKSLKFKTISTLLRIWFFFCWLSSNWFAVTHLWGTWKQDVVEHARVSVSLVCYLL